MLLLLLWCLQFTALGTPRLDHIASSMRDFGWNLCGPSRKEQSSQRKGKSHQSNCKYGNEGTKQNQNKVFAVLNIFPGEISIPAVQYLVFGAKSESGAQLVSVLLHLTIHLQNPDSRERTEDATKANVRISHPMLSKSEMWNSRENYRRNGRGQWTAMGGVIGFSEIRVRSVLFILTSTWCL